MVENTAHHDRSPAVGDPRPVNALVDVVVPVYRGLADTRRCLESLLAFPQATAFAIIVVNDCSPDAEIGVYLRELAAAGKITLLENEVNLGFVDSVNLGMRQHPQRDIVILNSDTEVHGPWLDRLRRCALNNADTGTVTPFSNNATICSYPRYLDTNSLPAGWPLGTLDDLFAEVNAGQAITIPTAVGFCTYITRRCLDRIGYFDRENFGRGYGEENDFSMRAAAEGFRNLLCADTFVYHSGGVSFGSGAQALKAVAEEAIRRLHPSYEPLIHQHFHADPERPLRRRVDIARLQRSGKLKFLFMTHRLGGGVEKHVQDLVRLLSPEAEILILRPEGGDRVSLSWANAGEEFNAFFDLAADYERLLAFLQGIGIDHIHFHHAVEFPVLALQLLKDLPAPYDCTIHDYYSVCPQWNLIRKDGNYCGEPDVEGCNGCLAEHPALAGLDISSWRAKFREILQGADRVIAPSHDALERIRRYAPAANFVFLPHPDYEASAGAEPELSASGEVKVLVLGELAAAKGVHLLQACAADAKARNLPLCFRVWGWSRDKIESELELPLIILGPYRDEDLLRLIEQERADIIFFPARCPETYSYTLTVAMMSGRAIVAPNLGAFPERLEDYPAAWLQDWDSPAAQWNDLFISVARPSLSQVSHGS